MLDLPANPDKRILIASEFFFPWFGGIEIRFQNLAEKWVNLGYHVDVVVLDHLETLPQNENINGINLIRLHKNKNYYKGGRFGRKISALFIYNFLIVKFFFINRNRYDAVVFNQYLIPAIIMCYFIRANTISCVDFVEYRSGLAWNIINKLILSLCDKVACISDPIKRKALLFREKEVATMPNSVEIPISVSKKKED